MRSTASPPAATYSPASSNIRNNWKPRSRIWTSSSASGADALVCSRPPGRLSTPAKHLVLRTNGGSSGPAQTRGLPHPAAEFAIWAKRSGTGWAQSQPLHPILLCESFEGTRPVGDADDGLVEDGHVLDQSVEVGAIFERNLMLDPRSEEHTSEPHTFLAG